MVVSVVCDTEGTKRFQVVSEQGWGSANKHVLRKMLESESETSQPAIRPKTRLTSDNYKFQTIRAEAIEGRPAYVIEVIPKRSNKYLFSGRCCFNSFSNITRVELSGIQWRPQASPKR